MSVEHILHVQPEGYLEPHDGVGSQNPSILAHWWDSNGEPFNSVCCVIPLCQPPHMKNKKNKIIYEK